MFLYDIAQRDDPDDSSNPSLSSSDSFDSEKNRTSLIVWIAYILNVFDPMYDYE